MLSIQRLTEENFFNMQSTWNELLSASMADSFFLSWEWLSEWWKHFGKGKELFVLAVRDSDGICGIAPLLREKQIVFQASTSLTDWVSRYPHGGFRLS